MHAYISIFCDGLWYDPARARTHDLLHERQTRQTLLKPSRRPKNGVAFCACVFFSLKAVQKYK